MAQEAYDNRAGRGGEPTLHMPRTHQRCTNEKREPNNKDDEEAGGVCGHRRPALGVALDGVVGSQVGDALDRVAAEHLDDLHADDGVGKCGKVDRDKQRPRLGLPCLRFVGHDSIVIAVLPQAVPDLHASMPQVDTQEDCDEQQRGAHERGKERPANSITNNTYSLGPRTSAREQQRQR